MDIFVISLKRSQDRKNEFDKNNSQYLKNYTYFEAVDGKTIDVNSLGNKIFKKGTLYYTPGALGVALSHLALWEKCIELNKPIIVMEDDLIVCNNFHKYVNNIMNNMLPKDWDIVQLSYNYDSILCYKNTIYEQCNCTFNKTKMSKSDIEKFVTTKVNTTISKLIYCFGTSCYIVSPKGARILKEKCFPLSNSSLNIPYLNKLMCYTIDCMMNTAYKDMEAYVVINPFVMTPHICDDYVSTI